MILFINACVRKNSRTKRLADAYLAKKKERVEELNLLDVEFPTVDENFLEKRDGLIAKELFSDPMFELARKFAEADEIVIAAPFWDLSFPARLKMYFEQINVVGITFRYTVEGAPQGLCKAKKMTYITTAGGNFFPSEFGFGYVESLAKNFYGIKKVDLIGVTDLDMVDWERGEEILRLAIEKVNDSENKK